MVDTIREVFEKVNNSHNIEIAKKKQEIKDKAIDILYDSNNSFTIISVNHINNSVKVILEWQKAPLNLYV